MQQAKQLTKPDIMFIILLICGGIVFLSFFSNMMDLQAQERREISAECREVARKISGGSLSTTTIGIYCQHYVANNPESSPADAIEYYLDCSNLKAKTMAETREMLRECFDSGLG